MDDELRFKHHISCLVSGPSGSGKSSYCIRFLRNLLALCTECTFSGGIIWCYVRVAPSPIDSWPGRIAFVFTKECQQTLRTVGKTVPHILDDLLNEAYSNDVCDLFMKGSHQRNIGVILITQYLFHQGKSCRDISLNATNIVVLKNMPDWDTFSHLVRQVMPHDSNGLLQAYLHATVEIHGYLLDLSQYADDSLRFRTCTSLDVCWFRQSNA